MPTDITPTPFRAARNFALRGVAWSLGLFGLLRAPWIANHALAPVTQAQAGVATRLFGAASLPIDVTLACSGADATALCLAAVLAYPASRRMRLAGAVAGLALILSLNIVRIGTLGRAAASPFWFETLHVYLWPAALTLAIAGYVFGWMRVADRPLSTPASTSALASAAPRPASPAWKHFATLAALFLILFVAASPLYLQSAGVLALAAFIARSAAAAIGATGVRAYAVANQLWTPRGSFLVTQECISTPLVPIYLAAVCAYAKTWRQLTLGLLATLPLFVALGIARLLVLALPDVVASPIFFAHAFYQLLLGAVAVFLAAVWRHGSRPALVHAGVGIVVGVAGGVLLARVLPLFSPSVTAYQAGAALDDPQGAIAMLPSFQLGLYLALWTAAFVAVGWKRFLGGLALLGLTQTASVLALHALAGHAALAPHVRDVRGWAVAGPVLIFAAVVNIARPRG